VAVREGYLHDYLVTALIGIAFAMGMTSPATLLVNNWGPFIGAIIVGGLFGFVPGGLIAGYLSFRFHRMGENLEMSGLSIGFFTAFVYLVLDLITTVLFSIINQANAAGYFIAWIISVVFAFLFFSLGGYLSGMLERRPFAMPMLFNLSRIQRTPPPPPIAGAQMCPTCGRPMAFVQQYGRWYCENCKKYP
jgi:hypothetical protein